MLKMTGHTLRPVTESIFDLREATIFHCLYLNTIRYFYSSIPFRLQKKSILILLTKLEQIISP